MFESVVNVRYRLESTYEKFSKGNASISVLGDGMLTGGSDRVVICHSQHSMQAEKHA